MLVSYILLGISIATENFAAALLTATRGFTKLKPSVACILLYTVCFICFGFALLKINLGIGYATWGACGMVATTIAGYFFYKQRLTKIGFASLILVIVSIVALNMWG